MRTLSLPCVTNLPRARWVAMVSDRFPVPQTIPGQEVTDYDHLNTLRSYLAELTHSKNLRYKTVNWVWGMGCNSSYRFPGSQPVSFTTASLRLLETEDFWVCEKSDGVRVLVFILATQFASEVYLVDRKERFYLNLNYPFPHPDDATACLNSSIVDAELVIDVNQTTGEQTLRLCCFDLLVYEGTNLMKRPFSSRYACLAKWVVEPHRRFLQADPNIAPQLPFQVKVKSMEKSYGIEAVFKEHLPTLEHGSDGLIFTSAVGPYVIGTDQKILKWKPPEENSIDFRLELRFPPKKNNPHQPDYCAKPIFALMMNGGQLGELFFDTVEITYEEWERIKESGEQYDKSVSLVCLDRFLNLIRSRIVEVAWDADLQTWKILRFRDDKSEGNFVDIVRKIIQSIADGVSAETLIQHAGRIRAAWKARERSKEAIPQASELPVRRFKPRPQRAPMTKLALNR